MSRGAPLRGGDSAPNQPGVVLAVVHGAVQRGRITEALRGRYDVEFCEDVRALSTAVRSSPRYVLCVIVEMRDRNNRSTAEAVRELASAGLSVPIIAYCRAGAEYSAEIRALVLAGAHELLFDGIDDSGVALRAVLNAAQQACLGERAAAALLPLVGDRLAAFVRHVTAFPTTQHVSEVAEALGYNRKTLSNQCVQANVPPPQELLAWCRLCVVAELLATTPRTIESIALQLDFPSDTSLRNMIKRYTHLRASDVRAIGGIDCVVAAFRQAIIEHRGSRDQTG